VSRDLFTTIGSALSHNPPVSVGHNFANGFPLRHINHRGMMDRRFVADIALKLLVKYGDNVTTEDRDVCEISLIRNIPA